MSYKERERENKEEGERKGMRKRERERRRIDDNGKMNIREDILRE